jgi:hypothetical protein
MMFMHSLSLYVFIDLSYSSYILLRIFVVECGGVWWSEEECGGVRRSEEE